MVAKWFDFTISPAYIPVESVVYSTESLIQGLNENTAEERQDVIAILRKAIPPKINIPKKILGIERSTQ